MKRRILGGIKIPCKNTSRTRPHKKGFKTCGLNENENEKILILLSRFYMFTSSSHSKKTSIFFNHLHQIGRWFIINSKII
jgi:hypothetical protein